jgi:hypothetical protein
MGRKPKVALVITKNLKCPRRRRFTVITKQKQK